MLFSQIVNACVYVIDAVVEETSLLAAVHALHHVVVALLVAPLVACHVADAQHGAAIGAPVPLAGHANHRMSRRSALPAFAAAAAELDAVIFAASAATMHCCLVVGLTLPPPRPPPLPPRAPTSLPAPRFVRGAPTLLLHPDPHGAPAAAAAPAARGALAESS